MKGQGQGPPIQPPPKKPPPPPPRYAGPSYQGFLFILYSADNKPTHKLTIATQTVDARFSYTASITGTWSNDDGGSPHPIKGVINSDGEAINCSWPNGNGGTNTLSGSLSYSSVGKLGQLQPSAYLDGMVTSTGGTGGPGQVSGEGYGPLPPAIGNEA
jgi:hypothetical protein